MPYTIRYNARTAHLEGLTERTTGPATDNSATSGVVSYYAQSACAALTRSGHCMAAYGDPIDSIALALDTFRDVAKWKGLKLCANCERAATTALNRAYNAAHRNARDAAADLDRANSSDSESWQADAEQRSERTYDTYVELAAAVGRCLIFGCDGEAEYRSYCPEHDNTDDIEDTDHEREAIAALDALNKLAAEAAERVDPAVAAAGRASTIGKPHVPDPSKWNGCEARIYHNGVGSPCGRPRGHELGTEPGTAHRTTTGIEWMPGRTRPSYCPYARTTAGCDDCSEHGALVDRIMESGKARTYAEAEALAVAMEEEPEAFTPLAADPVTVYNNARARYRTLADRHEEHGGESNRAAAAAAWDAFVSAARAAGKCTDFTCYADAEPGADRCQRHHKRVTARLDHTEPGHAIALIDGGHGRQDAPQAWLAHEGGSWLLVDDYDGDTLNVKGPDPERAVHAWAALLGLRIDALTVSVEYAGGPVSPPVRAPERPACITLGWRMVGSDSAAHVFEAHGRAHDYRVIEHPDNAGALLRAVLRGTKVETYRRGYMTPVDARAAAQHYEARYGSVYVPVA